jgi:hypothetical protein
MHEKNLQHLLQVAFKTKSLLFKGDGRGETG